MVLHLRFTLGLENYIASPITTFWGNHYFDFCEGDVSAFLYNFTTCVCIWSSFIQQCALTHIPAYQFYDFVLIFCFNILPIHCILLRFTSVDFCCIQSNKHNRLSATKRLWIGKKTLYNSFSLFCSFLHMPWSLMSVPLIRDLFKNKLTSNLTNFCFLEGKFELRSFEISFYI